MVRWGRESESGEMREKVFVSRDEAERPSGLTWVITVTKPHTHCHDEIYQAEGRQKPFSTALLAVLWITVHLFLPSAS